MRVAAFQRLPAYDDIGAGGEALLADLLWADAEGVDLALFPEAHLGGHAYDHSTIERRALRQDGDPLRKLLARLATVRTVAIVGMFDQRIEGIYNSAAVIHRGRIVGTYAKAHPNEEGIIAGTAFPVFDCAPRSFGINICNDANHAAAAQMLADAGASLICYPLNNLLRPDAAERWRERHIANLQARARQTGCWVLSADAAGRHDGLVGYGCTALVRPDGEVVRRASELAEDVIVYDVP
jgi:predicted amidohydrolase